MSYSAVVTRVRTRPHPNADRLQLATTIGGNQVVVGLDVPDNALGVFFPTDGQLSPEACGAMGLYTKSAMDRLGLPYEPDHRFGFFDHNRRVRCQRFRGERSDGFWLPVEAFAWTTCGFLDEGQTFTELATIPICNKYFSPATLRAMKGGTKATRREVVTFPKHIDTEQFRYLTDLPDDAIVWITEKLHGTSGRRGLVLDETPLPPWKQWINRWWQVFTPAKAYAYLDGTRNVIVGRTAGPGFYGTDQFRLDAVEGLQLAKDEVIYFELVGWVNGEAPIMESQKVPDTMPEIKLHYQTSMMPYIYGQEPGTAGLYVYRITRVNPDGQQIDLSWQQVQQRCHHLGLKTVPLLATFFGGDIRQLQSVVEDLTDGPSTLDPRHIREGVVVRVESAVTGTRWLKNKSFTFGVLEGYIKEREDHVDLEEVS